MSAADPIPSALDLAAKTAPCRKHDMDACPDDPDTFVCCLDATDRRRAIAALIEADRKAVRADECERGDRLEAMAEFMAEREVEALAIHGDAPGIRSQRVCRTCNVVQPCPTTQALRRERAAEHREGSHAD
ncbi:hypothetical protein [Luteipulveratus mongoliensis]|uniref:Uncharacterized protein n=1 Tax=Luteipulveratus mongoliensis TaxID=571913 RepID=A0A0K1JGC5_9MICO|nr:hypothetical protein [Luteipulveratus mongoliensis]AKU15762.1 hypothetical protein VV02_07690 [Luteipulveratus mongoliensis]